MTILILLVIAGAVLYFVTKNKKSTNVTPPPPPTPTTPIEPCTDCELVKFDTRANFSYTAHWTAADGTEKTQFVNVGTTLEVCAKPGTANGGPFTVLGKC